MPEKSLSQISGRAREFYDKGTAALQRNNYDYAIEMFYQSLLLEPAFYDCREALRAAQHRKAEGKSGGFLKKVFGSAGKSSHFAKAQLTLRNNPVEAIGIAEQILNGDPSSVGAHKILAEAAVAADLPRTAVLSLEIAFKTAPEDRDLALRLAETCAKVGHVKRAVQVYSELQRAYPKDQDISMALKDVTAQLTMSEGGYETISSGKGSYRDILKDKTGAAALEEQNRQVKSEDVVEKLIQEYEARIPLEPSNFALLGMVAELYVRKNDFDRALDYYDKLLKAEGANDPTVAKAITDTTVKKLDHALAQLDPSAPDHEQELKRLKSEKLSFQLGECQKRADRYPNDLQISFELGQLYFQAGRLNEAIREFQRSQNNPHRRIASMNYLGQCFAQRGMHDIAARRFEEAIKEKPVFDDEKKELIYGLATVLEKMGKEEESIAQFKKIYETDIGFRDVAAKVDAYYDRQ